MPDMTDDQFLRRLAAADPVDPATLPSAGDPAARHLLDDILAADPIPTPAAEPFAAAPTAGAADGEAAVEVLELDRSPGGTRRGLGRGRALLVASAAAVLLLVGAVAVLAPDSTPSALAEVQGAAAATADADSGRIETTFTLRYEGMADGAGGGEGTLTGDFEAAYNGSDLGFSLRLGELPPEIGAEMVEGMPSVEDVRLVDDVIYVQQGGQWMAIDTDGLLGEMVARFVDPRTVLDTVQSLTETTEIGPAEIDGLDTTHYRSIVDLGDESLAQSGWLAFDGVGVEADGEVTIDLYVDGDGVLRRFDLSGDVRDPAGGGSGTFEVTTAFTDIGADIRIEVPDGAVPFNPMEDLLQD
jgi:hypothetical protein